MTDRGELIGNAREALTKVSQVDPASVARESELGSKLNLALAVPYLDECVQIAQLFLRLDFARVPTNSLNQLHSTGNAIVGLVEQMRQFDPMDGANQVSPVAKRDELIQRIETFRSNLYTYVAPILAYENAHAEGFLGVNDPDALSGRLKQAGEAIEVARSAKQEFDRLKEELTEQRGAADREIEGWRENASTELRNQQSGRAAMVENQVKALNERVDEFIAQAQTRERDQLATAAEALAKSKAELDAVIAVARKAAESAGVNAQHAHFLTLASEHETLAGTWLKATAGAIGALALFVVVVAWLWAYPAGTDPNRLPKLITFFAARALGVSVLLYVVIWSARIYSAHRHNALVNRHRQTALTTFGAFVGSTSDAETKNAVLLQATQAIFTAQPTGYLPTASEPTPHGPAVEVIRSYRSGKDD